jgi:hypothetical protein
MSTALRTLPVLLFAFTAACRPDAAAESPDAAASDTPPDAGLSPDRAPSAPVDAHIPAPADASAPPPTCDHLFGTPNEHTGLDDSACVPLCACGPSVYRPRTFDAPALSALRAAVWLDAPGAPASDPYAAPEAPADPAPGTVCALRFEADGYRAATYPGADAARADGAEPTHAGACGLCSSLADLATYVDQPDLTGPVRACGLSNLSDFEGLVRCLEGLGFTGPCATIWAYNTEHTRQRCGAVCLAWLDRPYHLPDGGLNPCLACDEAESGPVFKAVAGRTRRNSGLPNAMCRPCEEVIRLTHDYPLGSP